MFYTVLNLLSKQSIYHIDICVQCYTPVAFTFLYFFSIIQIVSSFTIIYCMLQAYLVHTTIYLAVWDTYNFLANATQGTSVSIDWKMEDHITTKKYSGEFSDGTIAYAFTK